MKILIVLLTSILVGNTPGDIGKFPSAQLKNLEGESVNIDDITSKHKKTIISFWASWCKPCKNEMDAIAEYYEEWQEDYDNNHPHGFLGGKIPKQYAKPEKEKSLKIS